MIVRSCPVSGAICNYQSWGQFVLNCNFLCSKLLVRITAILYAFACVPDLLQLDLHSSFLKPVATANYLRECVFWAVVLRTKSET